jgi:cell division protein FtsW
MERTVVLPAPPRSVTQTTFGRVGSNAYAAVRAQQVAAATRPDAIVLFTIAAMLLLGLIMVQSASQLVDPLDPTAFVRRDALWMALGVVALIVTSRIDYHQWRRVVWPGIIVAVVLVGLVLRFGASVAGAQRWLAFGSLISVQPSEIAKLAFILFAADQLTASERPTMRQWGVVGLAALALLALVLRQNDLGTTMILAACVLVVYLMADAPWWALLGGTVGALVVGSAVIVGSAFRQARITSFLHPLTCDPGASWQICQSLIALGSGGVVGRGLGDSLEKTGYLPAPFTDSIFAVIGEELGLWGTLLVMLCFGVLLWRGLRIARWAPDRMGSVLASGITCWLIVQAILNIGSCVAALPFTGVPLPFISYGGSSLVVSLAAVGMLLNISAQNAAQAARRTRQGQATNRPRN